MAPCTLTIIQNLLNFSLFSAFSISSDLHKAGARIKKYIVQPKVFFHLKFRILRDFEDISGTCPMSCPVFSNFIGQDKGQSQLS